MSELKTLKDFEEASVSLGSGPNISVNVVKLKQEAIRWIKENSERKFYCVICEQFNCDCRSSDCFKIYHWDEIYTWVKYFFNIKAEDLK